MVRLSRALPGLLVVLLLVIGLAPGVGPTPLPALATTPPDLRSLQYVGHTGGWALAVAVQGNLAYVGEGPRLTVLDVSVPGSLTLVGKTDPLPGHVHGVAIVGQYAYVATGYAGLRVVDVSTPSAPVEVDFYATLGTPRGVAVEGDHLYVADGTGGLVILRFAPPRLFLPIVLR